MLKVCKYFDTVLEAKEEQEDDEKKQKYMHIKYIYALCSMRTMSVDVNVCFECVYARVHVCVKIHKKGNERIYFRWTVFDF